MAVRTEDNKPAVITELVEVGENTYMRIENTENGFLLYSSADGQNWGQPLATQEMTMLDQIAGMLALVWTEKKPTAYFHRQGHSCLKFMLRQRLQN